VKDAGGSLEEIAKTLHIGGYSRHIFLCTGEACCDAATGQLSLVTGPNACFRTKAGCLRVCKDGPIAVVYPEGTWYAGITAECVPRLVEEHLVQGTPVKEWAFASNPLGESQL
jgi:(2Fe-2S) ferredoxin